MKVKWGSVSLRQTHCSLILYTPGVHCKDKKSCVCVSGVWCVCGRVVWCVVWCVCVSVIRGYYVINVV